MANSAWTTKGTTLLLVLAVSAISLFTNLQISQLTSSSAGLAWVSNKQQHSPGSSPLDEREIADLLGRVTTTTQPRTASRKSRHGEKNYSSATAPAATEPPSPILLLLKEIEGEQLLLERSKDGNRKPIALVRGSSVVVERDLPLYTQGLEKAGFEVRVSKQAAHGRPVNLSVVDQSAAVDWTLLLCMSFNDGDGSSCMIRPAIKQLKPHQKISRIPGVRSILWRKEGLCRTTMDVHHLSALAASPIAPLCWALPSQFDGFASVVSVLGGKKRWVFKPLTAPVPGEQSAALRVMSSSTQADLKQMQSYRQRSALVQELIESPLLVNGFHVSIRAYVLVTSASPLRVYWHQEGLVYFRQDEVSNFKKVPNRQWYFAQLRQYLTRHHGENAEEKAFASMERAIVRCLLVAESSLAVYFGGLAANPGNDLYRCNHCFQLLGVDLILNQTLDATVMEVNGQPHMRESNKKDAWASNTIKATAIEEMMKLLFSQEEAASQLTNALEFLRRHMGLEDINCHKDEKLCLTREDLEFMLSTVRQNRARGNFIQIYPSVSGSVYDDLIKDLSHAAREQSPHAALVKSRPGAEGREYVVQQRWRDYHDTTTLHGALTAIESYFEAKALGNTQQLRDLARVGKVQAAAPLPVKERHDADNEESNNKEHPRADSRVEEDEAKDTKKEHMDEFDSLVGNVLGGVAPDKTQECLKDPDSNKLLASLSLSPGKLTPQFSSKVTSYRMTVANDVTLIHIKAFPAHCRTEYRLNNMKGTNKPANWSLEVGENSISILLVSLEHSEPWMVNKYYVKIYRESLTEHEPRFDQSEPHEVCYMPQGCGLRVYLDLPCGITHLSAHTWSQYITERASLPTCQNSYCAGRWVLPCSKCTSAGTCYWREALWLAKECRHVLPPLEEQRACMAGRKVLFIGDSTVRGMMFHMMERLNGSLHTWNKAHSIRSYHINRNISFGFSYYPQFFLSKAKQPVFEKALYMLLRRQRPLVNDRRTVVVIGGVQWLSPHHIQVVKKALDKSNLDKVTVVIKLHGAGFNQPIDGIIYSNAAKTRRLLYRHRMMLNTSLQLGYIPIDTFSMTLPRHKHYLYGRCACHFHTVVAVDEHGDPLPQVTESPVPDVRYHIEGPINDFYTQLTVAEICRRREVT